MQEDDPALGTVAVRPGLQGVHEAHQGRVQPEDGVLAVSIRIREEPVADATLLVLVVLVEPVGHHHVVHPLVRVAHGERILVDEVQVVVKGTFPVEIPPLRCVDVFRNETQQSLRSVHHDPPFLVFFLYVRSAARRVSMSAGMGADQVRLSPARG